MTNHAYVELKRWLLNILILVFGIFLLGLMVFKNQVYGEFLITPSFKVIEEYDDNIFRREENLEDDFKTSFSPGLKIAYRRPLFEVQLNYGGIFTAYAKHPDLGSFNQDGSLKINLDRLVGRLSKRAELNLTESIVFTSDLPDYSFDQEEAQDLNDQEILGRNKAFRNNFGVNFNYQMTRRSQLSMGYANVITEYSDPQLNDRIQHSGNTGINFRLGERDTLMFNGRYQIIMNSGGQNTDSYLGAIGWSHEISPMFSFQINGGYNYVPDVESQGESASYFGKASTEITFSRDTFFSFSYFHDVSTSGLSQQVIEQHGVNASISKNFSNDLKGLFRGLYRNSKGISEIDSLNLETYRFRLSLNYIINSYLNSSVSYSYSFQNSKGIIGEDVRVNTVQLQLTAILPKFKGF